MTDTAIARNQAKYLDDKRREVKRNIRKAYQQGRTVPYDLRTLIESGVSLKVIRAVHRG